MDTKQLTYFIVIAESKTITEAANKLHLAQPALSQSLKTLEGQLETQLVNRSRHQLTLTPAGEVLYKEGKRILQQIEETKSKILSANKEQTKIINVGLSTFPAQELMPVIRQLKATYPNTKINIQQNEADQLANHIRHQVLDIAIVPLPINTDRLEVITLKEEPLYFICSKSDKNRTHIETLTTNLTNPLILPSHQGTETYQNIRNHFNHGDTVNRHISDCSDIDLLLSMVEEDMGCSILPQSVLDNVPYDLDKISITDPNFSTTYGLIYSKELVLEPEHTDFIDSLIHLTKVKKIA